MIALTPTAAAGFGAAAGLGLALVLQAIAQVQGPRRRGSHVDEGPNGRPRTTASYIQARMEQTPGAEAKWSREVKAALVDPRLKLPVVLATLQARGHRPKVVFSWRSLASQAVLKQKGRSSLSFSKHNAVDRTGQPRALAADIIDERYGWGDGEHGSAKSDGALGFFRALGEVVDELGLGWGGRWKSRGSFWTRYGMGWDPAHIEVAEVSVAQAQRVSLAAILGTGFLRRGSGGYVYRVFSNGYILVVGGRHGVGKLLTPVGDARAWTAVWAEVGAVS